MEEPTGQPKQARVGQNSQPTDGGLLVSSKISIELGPVQETLLIPLLGRAAETKKKNGLIRDDKAVHIVDALDYDFSKWRGARSLQGASLRTRMYDEEVSSFLAAHPTGTVIEIGAGLNTRYERLDNGQARWIELDLPDSMELRRRFFEETDRRKMIATSVLDSDWHTTVLDSPGPYFFVSEAVIIYLDESDAEQCLRSLAATFPGAQLIMDTTSTKMVDGQGKHDAMKKLSKDSWCRWRCDDPSSLTPWGLELEASKTFLDASPSLVAAMPLFLRWACKYFPFVLRRQVSGYRINLFRFRQAGE